MPSSADFSSDEILDEIISLTVELEEQYKQAFYRSIEEAVGDPALIDLLQDISDGTVIGLTPQVEDILQNLNVPVSDLIDALRETMARVGQVTADTVGLEISFDMTNPRAVQYAETLGARTITASAAVKQSIREIIKEVVEGELSIQNAQRLIKERAGLLPKHAQAVARYYDNLVASGSTARRARELANQYANRLLNYRVDMIARTEIGAAQSYGQLELWQQARDRGLVPLDAMRVWMTAKDELVCDVCGPMNGEVAPIDGVWFTPNGPVHYPTEIHPNCRCASGLVFSRGRAREFLNKSIDLGYERWLLEKHLGTQHDQMTHGRRKAQAVWDGRQLFEDLEWEFNRPIASQQEEWAKFSNYAVGLKNHIAKSIGNALDEEFSEDDLRETSRLLDAKPNLTGAIDEYALYAIDVDRAVTQDVLRGLARMDPLSGDPMRRTLFGDPVVEWEVGDDFAKYRIKRLYEEVDPDTGVGKVMAEMSLVGANPVDAPESMTSEVAPRTASSDFTIGSDLFTELGMVLDDRLLSDLALIGKGQGFGTYAIVASDAAGVQLGLEQTNDGGLKVVGKPSSSNDLPITGNYDEVRATLTRAGVLSEPTSYGYGITKELVSAWALSSTSPVSQLLHDQVSQMFGLADYKLADGAAGYPDAALLEDTYYNSRTKPVIRRAAELMYENTQELLAKTTEGNVLLFRGIANSSVASKAQDDIKELPKSPSRLKMKTPEDSPAKYGLADVEQRPVSSWTSNYELARAFANTNANKGRGDPAVLVANVPKSRIFALPFTGPGCYQETEFLVLGSEADPTYVFVTPKYVESVDLVQTVFDAEAVAFDEVAIKKAAEGNINIDADISNADWPKQTFDFPEVTTAKKYREEFGLEDDEALDKHIKEWKDTPYWEGIPSKIKTELLKARLSKHLGSQHDQQTHGRRKTAARWTQDDLDGASHDLRQPFNYTADVITGSLMDSITLRDDEVASAISEIVAHPEWWDDMPLGDLELRDQANRVMKIINTTWNDDPEHAVIETYMDAIGEVLDREQGLEVRDVYQRGAVSFYSDLSDNAQEFLRQLALEQYLATQATLADNDIKSVRVWRGVTAGKGDGFPDTDTPLSQAEVAGDALSSWSTDYSAARAFAQNSPHTLGVILHTVLPAEYVFSAGSYQGWDELMGTASENEVVVLGNPIEADVLTRFYSEDQVDLVLTGERSPFREGEVVEKAKKTILVDEDKHNRCWLRSS